MFIILLIFSILSSGNISCELTRAFFYSGSRMYDFKIAFLPVEITTGVVGVRTNRCFVFGVGNTS